MPEDRLSLPKSRFVRIDGPARQDRMRNNVSEPLDLARVGARPSRPKREFARHYNRRHISQEFVEGALR
jgi:hypothetical protein